MPRLLRFLAPLLFASTALVAQTTLLNDTFSDGSFADQSLSSSAQWFNSSTSGISLSSGSLSISAGRHALAYFTSAGSTQSLGIGDSLTVALDITFSSIGNASGGFRVGLFDSNGATRPSANGDNASFTGYNGYIFTAALASPDSSSNTTNGLTLRERVTGVNGALLSTTSGGLYTTAGSGGGPTGQTLATGTTYSLNYTISRTDSTTLSHTFTLSGGSLSGFTNTFSDSSASTTEFDAFAILSTSTNGSAFAIDNVAISYSAAAIPEPSTYALLFGGVALLGLAYRRRRCS